MSKWTWSLYKLIIGTRHTQAYCIHEELVRINQEKWDAKYEARVKEVMQPRQRQTRQNRPAPSREVAEMQAHREISSLKYGLGPRPKALSQLEFAIRIVRGLLGLPMPLFGKRRVGRPEGEPASKKKRVLAGKEVMSTPERKKQREMERAAAYSSVKKNDCGAAGEGSGGRATSNEYPNNRIVAGAGLRLERLDSSRGLQHHRPRDMVVDMMVRDNDHRCQVCTAVGPLWKGGTCFRGGPKTKPRRAILMCVAPGCLRNFCSAACFNWWHVGGEFAPTRKELSCRALLS